jgi:alpha-glucosidase
MTAWARSARRPNSFPPVPDNMNSIVSPRHADPEWWRGAVIYQIYPRSFQDSNDDGIGDLAGIVRRLPYLASLGVDALWVSPFFPSPMRDFGYDITDYCGVDPRFGTLADFDALVREAHACGLKLLIDLVLSHTSADHPWFVESRAARANPKADWYVWAEANPDGTPPNNWLSLFGGSAWQWDTGRCQYYLHNFLASQPDLNFHHPEVQEAALDVVRFWMARGVDGFRLDVVNFYFHDRDLKPNPPQPAGAWAAAVPLSNPYAFQHHLYDKTQPENLAFLQRLRALLDTSPGMTTIGEIGDDAQYRTLGEYTREGRLHMAYTFNLMGADCTPRFIHETLAEFLAETQGAWACWALNNHDVVRVATRWSALGAPAQIAPVLVAFMGALRGSICLYQGEELGLTEAEIPFAALQDPYGKEMWPRFKGRDGCRTPLPWQVDGAHAGFSEHAPWLPLFEEHRAFAAERQEADPGSVLAAYRRFLAFRRGQPALVTGAMRLLPAHDQVVAWIRGDGADQVLCVFNLSGAPARYEIDPVRAERLDAADSSVLLELDEHSRASACLLPPHSAFFARLHTRTEP